MRVLFMGSPLEVISVVEKLQLLQQHGDIELVAVVSQLHQSQRGLSEVESPVSLFAKAQRITCYQPRKASALVFMEKLRDLQLDVILTAAYGQILTTEFLAIPKRAVINIHPSLLPRWRGAAPVVAAVREGVTTSGVTICFTVREVDAGNIIVQQTMPLPEQTHHRNLTELLFRAGAELLPTTFKLLIDPDFRGRSQDQHQVSRCKKVSKEDGLVDWGGNAIAIYRQYLACYGWPETFTFFHGQRVILKEMQAPRSAASPEVSCGAFTCDRKAKLLCINTSDGLVVVPRLQVAGRRAVDAWSFWNGVADRKPHIFTAKEGSCA